MEKNRHGSMEVPREHTGRSIGAESEGQGREGGRGEGCQAVDKGQPGA